MSPAVTQDLESGIFKPEFDSPAKRVTRVLVYNEVLERRRNPLRCRVLILPGRVPAQEIYAAKTLLNAHVTAIDVDPVAIEAAESATADTVIRGSAAELDDVDAFDFINLDVCPTITTEWVLKAMSRAAVASRAFVATWFSCGREMVGQLKHDGLHQLREKFGDVGALPEVVRNRLCFAWSEAYMRSQGLTALERMRQLRPLKTWAYSRNSRGARMIAILWTRERRYYPRGPKRQIEHVKVSSEIYYEVVAEYARRRYDVEKLFNITRAQLAAWKAMREERRDE